MQYTRKSKQVPGQTDREKKPTKRKGSDDVRGIQGFEAQEQARRDKVDGKPPAKGNGKAKPVPAIRQKHDSMESMIMDYAGLNAHFAAGGPAIVERNNLLVKENGGLFFEAESAKARSAYGEREPAKPKTSKEEKLHVPATAADVGERWALVSQLCLERGVCNWKVAKQQFLDNKISGQAAVYQTLLQAGLLDKGTPKDQPPVEYIRQALKDKGDRRKRLQAFVKLDDVAFQHELDEQKLSATLMCTIEESAVLGATAFPEEQCGREITIYIKPELFPEQTMFSEFVSELFTRFRASGFEPLPIAAGDMQVAEFGAQSGGKTMGYFSYRNEEMAKDPVVGGHQFPHWMGGNALETNAAQQPMELDKAYFMEGWEIEARQNIRGREAELKRQAEAEAALAAAAANPEEREKRSMWERAKGLF